MEHFECDQFSMDIQLAIGDIVRKTGATCTLRLDVVTRMTKEIETMSRIDGENTDLIECVLEQHEPFTHDTERACYKRALERIFTRRKYWRESGDVLRGKDAPFAPR